MKNDYRRRVRVSVVLFWLIFAYSILGILGFSVPNCMQEMSFGEALRHMHFETYVMPQLFLISVSQVFLFYAHLGVRGLRGIRFLICFGTVLFLLCAVNIFERGGLLGIAEAPLLPFRIARGVPGFVWAEGDVLSSAYGLLILLWLGLTLIDYRDAITRTFKRFRIPLSEGGSHA